MTTRIDRRFAALKDEGRAALVTFVMAGDPDYDNLARDRSRRCRKAGADVIELGMPFTDPMADGPAIQAAGLRALKAGQNMKRTLALVREFRRGRCHDADRADGLLQSDLRLRRRRDSSSTPRAAGVDGLIVVDLPPEEDDGIVPAGAQGRPQFHPPRDADDRRQAAAGGARQHVGLCLLRLDHRHHRRGGARYRQGRRGGGSASSATPRFRSASASACAPPSRPAPSPPAPTAWWSARPWSIYVRGQSGAGMRVSPGDSLPAPWPDFRPYPSQRRARRGDPAAAAR